MKLQKISFCLPVWGSFILCLFLVFVTQYCSFFFYLRLLTVCLFLLMFLVMMSVRVLCPSDLLLWLQAYSNENIFVCATNLSSSRYYGMTIENDCVSRLISWFIRFSFFFAFTVQYDGKWRKARNRHYAVQMKPKIFSDSFFYLVFCLSSQINSSNQTIFYLNL